MSARLVAALLAGLALAGCDVKLEASSKPRRPDPVPWASIKTDAESGCQYLMPNVYQLVPRIGSDGVHVIGCKEGPYAGGKEPS